MKKYKKITEEQVLQAYFDLTYDNNNALGVEFDYVNINLIAFYLKTSKYQVRKIVKQLKDKGFLELTKVCTYAEEYDNGLYVQDFPILYTKVYELTSNGKNYLRSLYATSYQQKNV